MRSPASNKTDIDTLILFEHRVNLMNLPVILLQLVRVLVPVDLTKDYKIVVVVIGLLLQFVATFLVGHRAFGSLIIAGVRVFYIKFHHVMLRVGVEGFVTCAKWASFSVVFTLVIGHVTENYFFRDASSLVYYEYFTDLKLELGEFDSIFDHILPTFALLSNLLEFIFFLVIINELAKLNKGASSLFSSSRRNVARKRSRKNVITGIGHFVSWLAEMFIFVFIQSFVMANKDLLGLSNWIFFMLLPSMNYVIFPIVQILTSDEMRQYVFGWMHFSRNCRRKSDQKVEQMEMNVLTTNANPV